MVLLLLLLLLLLLARVVLVWLWGVVMLAKWQEVGKQKVFRRLLVQRVAKPFENWHIMKQLLLLLMLMLL